MPRGRLTDQGRREFREQADRRARIYRRRRALAAVLVIGVLLLIGYFVPRAFNAVATGLGAEQPLAEVRGDQLPQAPDPDAESDSASGAESDGASDAESDSASGLETDSDPTAEPAPESTPEPTPEPTPGRASEASWDPDSIHVLVNARNPLEPLSYAPEDLVVPEVRTTTQNQLLLREPAAEALAQLIEAANQDGEVLAMTSGYRSYEAQRSIYANRQAAVGTEETDELVARPGYSEHQTGLAADVISIENPECTQGHCFAETSEGRWVAENAAEHGFVIRYLEGAQEITGYEFEPWHLRYVGRETAEEVAAQGLTLEEYWDQPAAPDYDSAAPELPAAP